MSLPQTSEDSLQHIFSSIIKGYLKDGFKPETKSLDKAIVEASLLVYKNISLELRPTPAKSHYTFNLRDISKVF